MGDGLRGMAMNLCASTAMMGQSAIRGLACGAQEVRASHVDFSEHMNGCRVGTLTNNTACNFDHTAVRSCLTPLACTQVMMVAGNALSSGSAGPRGMLQRSTALQAAPRFRTRLALPQLRIPGRRRAALVTS